MGSYTYHECDACGFQVSGYSTNELTKDGWVWHPVPNRADKGFVCCGDCEHKFEQRRRDAAELDKAVA